MAYYILKHLIIYKVDLNVPRLDLALQFLEIDNIILTLQINS